MIKIPVEPPITEYLHVKAARMRIPLNASFELTPVCNMDCRMCYVRMSKEQQEAVHPLRTAKEWLSLAEDAKQRGMLYLLLTGGEPFIRPDFQEIYTGLHQMGFVLTINSNATLIDEEVVEWLKEIPPVRINITLYGASDETYGRLCRNPKGFTQVTRAIHLLKEAGISVKLNCSVTPYNAGDLEEMIAFAKKEHLIIQPTSYMFPPLRRDISKVGQNDRFTAKEAAYYSAKIESLLNGEEDFLERMKTKDLSLPSDPGDDCLETEGEGIRCRAGKCSFWVTWDGRLLPCGMLPGTGVEDVFKIGFDEAWKRASEYALSIRLPSKCSFCGLKDQCKACAAMVYTESGDYCTVPKYRCEMAHEYPGACKEIEAEILERKTV
ncbi:MAG: radical SAM protein [Lachnospiraceae bacterium]|nr:radical SAM protein [Lachnospiraceae bacterium]